MQWTGPPGCARPTLMKTLHRSIGKGWPSRRGCRTFFTLLPPCHFPLRLRKMKSRRVTFPLHFFLSFSFFGGGSRSAAFQKPLFLLDFWPARVPSRPHLEAPTTGRALRMSCDRCEVRRFLPWGGRTVFRELGCESTGAAAFPTVFRIERRRAAASFGPPRRNFMSVRGDTF